MSRLIAITLLGFLTSVQALTDVQTKCISENSETFSNDALIGTWYEMYRFSLFGGLVPSQFCPTLYFTKPTAELIDEYKEKYKDPDLPYSFDDNPVVRNDSYFLGMVMGNKIAKFYVLDPKEVIILIGGFAVTAFRPLTDKYIMWQDCAMRGNALRLLALDRHAPVSDMQELIKNTPQLADKQYQRFCATY